MKTVAIALSFLLLSAFPVVQSRGQDGAFGGRSGAASAGEIKVEPTHQLRKGVDAWPLIVSPNDVAAQRVNAVLTEMNRKLAKALIDCDANYTAWAKMVNLGKTGGNSTPGDWKRMIEVTMAGPRFLSIVATDDFVFCGGAHPDYDRNALVFDLRSGSLLDWGKFIAKSAGAASRLGSGLEGAVAPSVLFPALERMNVEAADKDCKDAFRNQQPFLIWPAANRGALVIEAADMPQVVQACAEEIPLTMEQARQLGFSESLLRAIEDADKRIEAKTKR